MLPGGKLLQVLIEKGSHLFLAVHAYLKPAIGPLGAAVGEGGIFLVVVNEARDAVVFAFEFSDFYFDRSMPLV